MFRFLALAAIAASLLIAAPASFADTTYRLGDFTSPHATQAGPLDDQQTTQRSRQLRPFLVLIPRANADTLAPPDAADTPATSSDWLAGMILAVLSPVVLWLLTRAAGWLHIDAKSKAFQSLKALADSALDMGARKTVAEGVTAAHDKYHDTVVVKAFDELWLLASPFIATLGWSEDRVKQFLANELAPAT